MKKILLITMVCFGTSASAQNLSNNLVTCYPMDCSTQNYASTGPTLNGTAVNLTCTVGHTGLPGTGYQFSGDTNSYFRIPGNAMTKPSNSITVSGWYRPTNPSPFSQYCVFTRKSDCTSFNWEAYYLAVIPGDGGNIFQAGKGDVNSCGTNIASSNSITIGNWYHVAFYIDNNVVELYVNGTLVDQSMPFNSAFSYFAGHDVILGGAANSAHYLPFTGSMDNVRFYDRKLTQQEINILYSQDPSCQISTIIKENQFSGNELSFFPNPSNGNITIKGTGENDELELRIMDLTGKIVYTKNIASTSSGTNLDIQGLESSLYLIEIQNKNNQVARGKLIKTD